MLQIPLVRHSWSSDSTSRLHGASNAPVQILVAVKGTARFLLLLLLLTPSSFLTGVDNSVSGRILLGVVVLEFGSCDVKCDVA